MANARGRPRKISLAIQGGAAHGAFAWGVLDRLLEEEDLVFEGLSGTSSGAVNASLIACGLVEGGSVGARRRLESFWWGMSEACKRRRRPWFTLMSLLRAERRDLSSTGVFYNLMSRLLLPYDFNPANMNPLRQVIADTVDFTVLEQAPEHGIRLFVNATNVLSNKLRIFRDGEVTLDAVCASSCLPFLFQPVEIEGVPYWDGGYVGNPPIYPLAFECDATDVILIQSNPINIARAPDTATGILERINEVAFTSTMLREMRALKLVADLVENGQVKRRAGLHPLYIHMIEAPPAINDLEGVSRFNADWTFFTQLHGMGREVCEAWLAENLDAIGAGSTLDIEDTFM